MTRWLLIVGRHLLGITLYVMAAWALWRLWHRFPWEYGQFEVKEGLYARVGDLVLAVWAIPGYAFVLLGHWFRKRKPVMPLSFLYPSIAGLVMGGSLQLWVYLGWFLSAWLAEIYNADTAEGFMWVPITFILAPLLSAVTAAWLTTLFPLNLRNFEKPGQTTEK